MDLPLFPLNLVLFPGMPLKLHIFEERYKTMINECVESQTPFGVVLIEEGMESLGPLARPHAVGCTAHITQVQRLPFGRMNIVAIGRERFLIHEMKYDRAFLSADVEILPLVQDDAQQIKRDSIRLHPLVRRYLQRLESAGQIQFDSDHLPDNPVVLAYMASVMLQMDNDKKQMLLNENAADQLIRNLVDLYRLEVALLDFMLSGTKDDQADESTFSVN